MRIAIKKLKKSIKQLNRLGKISIHSMMKDVIM